MHAQQRQRAVCFAATTMHNIMLSRDLAPGRGHASPLRLPIGQVRQLQTNSHWQDASNTRLTNTQLLKHLRLKGTLWGALREGPVAALPRLDGGIWKLR